jgi:hypothetical protein
MKNSNQFKSISTFLLIFFISFLSLKGQTSGTRLVNNTSCTVKVDVYDGFTLLVSYIAGPASTSDNCWVCASCCATKVIFSNPFDPTCVGIEVPVNFTGQCSASGCNCSCFTNSNQFSVSQCTASGACNLIGLTMTVN